MKPQAIFGPVYATMLLTLAVWIYMYLRRIAFITGSGLRPEQLAIPGELARRSPPGVSNPSDNLKNLCEIPLLFYALAIGLYVTQRVDALDVAAGWVFFSFRALHSLVHCTCNRVMLRFYLYLVSTVAVWFLLVRAVLAYTGVSS